MKERYVDEDKLYIRFLVAIVGQACNLRCRDCGNFAPFAPRDTLRYDVDRIIGDLKRITRYSRIRLLQVQGGEPFLYSQLETLLDFVDRCRDIEKCLIATNGAIMPNVNPDLLRHEKFTVRISNYPVAANISAKVQSWLSSNAVSYEVYHFVSKEDKWFDLGKKLNPGEDPATRYERCLYRNCLTLENGFLGHCSRAVIAQKLQGFSLNMADSTGVGGGGYIAVSDSGEFKARLSEYIRNPQYMEACRYCNGTGRGATLDPAIQIKPGETWEDFL